MKAQTRRILFTLAGAALGMLAGAGFGMGKGIAASAAFLGGSRDEAKIRTLAV